MLTIKIINKSNIEKDKFKFRNKGFNKEKINCNNGKGIFKINNNDLTNIRKLNKRNCSIREDFYIKNKTILKN